MKMIIVPIDSLFWLHFYSPFLLYCSLTHLSARVHEHLVPPLFCLFHTLSFSSLYLLFVFITLWQVRATTPVVLWHTQLNHRQLGLPAKRASVKARCPYRSQQSVDSVDKTADTTG